MNKGGVVMKKVNLLAVWTVAVLLLLPMASFGSDPNALVQTMGQGSVNWTEGYIEAKGIGAPPEASYGKPNARPMAMRAAKLDALRNILEVVNGVRVNSTTLVRDFTIESDLIRAEVDGIVRGAQQADLQYMSDGTVEVVMRVPLHGGFSEAVLPQDIQQIGSITTDAPAQQTGGVFTGLVVDARGLEARPAMAPKVLDENGQEVYGSAFVSREYAVQQGMSGYAKALEAAMGNERVTDNPLTVKGLRTEGPGRCDIVISNADATRIRNAAEHLSFMKKCRVMIVVD
jgi:hypothetical protein